MALEQAKATLDGGNLGYHVVTGANFLFMADKANAIVSSWTTKQSYAAGDPPFLSRHIDISDILSQPLLAASNMKDYLMNYIEEHLVKSPEWGTAIHELAI